MKQSQKLFQYVMLITLYAMALILPAVAAGRMVKESAGQAVTERGGDTESAGGTVDSDTENAGSAAAGGAENVGNTVISDTESAGSAAAGGTENTGNTVDSDTESAADSAENMTGEEKLTDNDSEKGTIVIDAGHGGDDPGMIGSSGISEKVLNLIYAKKLQALLEAAGYRVVQTRETEDGLYDAGETNKKAQDMQRRVAIIAEEAPLVSVSIHQNSYEQDSSVCGPQVFYYQHSAEGEKLAKAIQDCMNEQLEIARPRVQKGNDTYYILKRSVSTTVIVECGFLTNPEEEQKLQEEAYQDRVVQAICDGVLNYLEGDGA